MFFLKVISKGRNQNVLEPHSEFGAKLSQEVAGSILGSANILSEDW